MGCGMEAPSLKTSLRAAHKASPLPIGIEPELPDRSRNTRAMRFLLRSAFLPLALPDVNCASGRTPRAFDCTTRGTRDNRREARMNLRVSFPFVATILLALAQPLFAQTTNRWRVFSRTDGLPDNACLSVTLG